MAKNKIYKGIDISLFQPGADFPAIKAAGIDFVMLKAGQGRIPGEWNAPFTDPYFERYIKAADAAGLYAGSYWYFMANSEAEVREEAAYYIALLRKYKFNHQLWAALDVEDSHLTGDRAALTARVKLFCDLVRAAGFRPMVYANSWWLESGCSDMGSELERVRASLACENVAVHLDGQSRRHKRQCRYERRVLDHRGCGRRRKR